MQSGPTVVFEQSRDSHRPSLNLAPGRHTISVAVEVGNSGLQPAGPGQNELIWSFFVDSLERTAERRSILPRGKRTYVNAEGVGGD